MMDVSWAGVALVLSAAASLGTLITGILFFTAGGLWGPINDAVSVLQMLAMGVAALGVQLLARAVSPLAALLALLVGAAAMTAIAVMQALLVLRAVTFEQAFAAVLACGIGIGIWLVITSLLMQSLAFVPLALAILGVVTGIAYCLPIIAYLVVGQSHPLFYVGSLVGVLGYAVWEVWLGSLL